MHYTGESCIRRTQLATANNMQLTGLPGEGGRLVGKAGIYCTLGWVDFFHLDLVTGTLDQDIT